MRLYIERNMKLKFKGCNHPSSASSRLLNRPRRQNTSPDYFLGPRRNTILNQQSLANFNRSSSMTQLPTINRNKGTIRNGSRDSSRQRCVSKLFFWIGGDKKTTDIFSSFLSFYEGLPPVLGTNTEASLLSQRRRQSTALDSSHSNSSFAGNGAQAVTSHKLHNSNATKAIKQPLNLVPLRRQTIATSMENKDTKLR